MARKATLAEIYSRTLNQQRPLSEVLAEHYPWCCEDAAEIGQVFRELTRSAHDERDAEDGSPRSAPPSSSGAAA